MGINVYSVVLNWITLNFITFFSSWKEQFYGDNVNYMFIASSIHNQIEYIRKNYIVHSVRLIAALKCAPDAGDTNLIFSLKLTLL